MRSGVAGLVNGVADRGIVERGTDHADELRVEVHLDRIDATHCAHLSGNRGAAVAAADAGNGVGNCFVHRGSPLLLRRDAALVGRRVGEGVMEDIKRLCPRGGDREAIAGLMSSTTTNSSSRVVSQ